MTPTKRFVELDKAKHDRQSFNCGNTELNQFFQHYALQHRQAGISRTFVLPARRQGERAAICSYYTLSHTEIERQTLPKKLAKKLPHYPVPVLLIGQLAVHQDCHGQGLGKVTLLHALRNIATINMHLPSFAVIVDALDDTVLPFYQQYGFEVLDTDRERSRLFLPMKTVTALYTPTN